MSGSRRPRIGHCAVPYLSGQAIVEQSQLPNMSLAGSFIYIVRFNSSGRSAGGETGEFEPAYFGGFQGTRGEFYGDDAYNGRPIKVRVIWTNPDRDHARWEQSFSFDRRILGGQLDQRFHSRRFGHHLPQRLSSGMEANPVLEELRSASKSCRLAKMLKATMPLATLPCAPSQPRRPD